MRETRARYILQQVGMTHVQVSRAHEFLVRVSGALESLGALSGPEETNYI